MSTYEKISIAISLLSFVTVVIGVVYGAIQLKRAAIQLALTSKIHQDNHDWNRRLAAQEALREYSYSAVSGPLQEAFDYLNIKEPLPLHEIQL